MITYKNDDIKSVELIKDFFLINWHMTGWCNYHCWFCIASQFQTKWISEENMIKYADGINEFINTKLPTDRKVSLKLIGGEVTYYNLEKILDHIQRVDKIVLVTNLSKELEYFYSLEDYCKRRNIQLVLICSLHDENKDFEQKFLTLTKWCRERRGTGLVRAQNKHNYTDPQVTMVVTKDFDKSLVEHYKNDLGIWRIRLTRMREQTQCNDDLDQNVLDYVYDYNQYYEDEATSNGKTGHTYKITLKDGNTRSFICASNFTNYLDKQGFIPDNYYCTAGKDSVAIMPNGDMTLARCDYLKNNIIGNVTNAKEIKFTNSGIVCKLNKEFGYSKKRCDLCAGTNLYRLDKDEEDANK